MAGALVLLSGGMDSAVCLFQAAADHGPASVKTVFFDWSQRAVDEELAAARALCAASGVVEPVVIGVRFPYGGALTEPGARLPTGRTAGETSDDGVAGTFFPGRNIVFLSYAFGLAAVSGHTDVYFGASSDDAAGYPDCRMEFLRGMEEAARLGLGCSRLSLVLPLIDLDKPAIVRRGEELDVPWELSFSCYAPVDGGPCGECDSCVLREDSLGRQED